MAFLKSYWQNTSYLINTWNVFFMLSPTKIFFKQRRTFHLHKSPTHGSFLKGIGKIHLIYTWNMCLMLSPTEISFKQRLPLYIAVPCLSVMWVLIIAEIQMSSGGRLTKAFQSIKKIYSEEKYVYTFANSGVSKNRECFGNNTDW